MRSSFSLALLSAAVQSQGLGQLGSSCVKEIMVDLFDKINGVRQENTESAMYKDMQSLRWVNPA